MKKLYLIIGAPGSGKTTDASIVAKNRSDVVHYSTGDMLREEVKSGSELGKKIDSFISKGELVPLDIVIDTIIKAIRNAKKDIILIDGFPRSVEQMRALDKALKDEDVELKKVIEIVVSKEVAKKRVLGRKRGSDDNEEVFKRRMEVFLAPLKEIEDFYNKKGILVKIDGERSIEEVVKSLEEIIE